MWEHIGTLESLADSIVVGLESEHLSKAIKEYRIACTQAVKHAKHFCWRLNQVNVSDTTSFNLTADIIDVDLCVGGPEDHFLFISHYKVEAGSEATLIRDDLEKLIYRDPSNVAG